MTGFDRRDFLKASALATVGTLTATAASAATPPSPSREPAACVADKPAGARAIDASIWRSYFDVRRVWGYANRHSVDPGEGFKIILTTGPGLDKIEGRIAISRIGCYDDEDRKRVWTSDVVTVERREIQATTASLGADWAPVIDYVPTDDWLSGYYTIDFIIGDKDVDNDVGYIIITNPERSGDVLVELSTNTYNAYNAWGGYSLYESAFAGARAQQLSFDRPASPAFFDYDYYLVRWLEELADQHGFSIDYASNFDVHSDRRFTENCGLYISGCHNEYWSKEQFDAVWDRIFKLGKNAIFFGANTAYWQVRYADLYSAADQNWGRQLVCYKSSDDPIRQRVEDGAADLLLTMMFRDGARRPETMLMGVGYQNFFEPGGEDGPRYPYQVATLDSPFFDGVNWAVGESIGNVVGYEWDNRDPNGDGNRLWDAQLSKIPRVNSDAIKVLFNGNPVGADGKTGLAEAVTFTSAAGGQVFSAGSIRWAWGLGKDRFDSDDFRKFNANVVLQLLAWTAEREARALPPETPPGSTKPAATADVRNWDRN